MNSESRNQVEAIAEALPEAVRESVLSGTGASRAAGVESLVWRDDIGAENESVALLIRAHREDLARHTPACSVHALTPADFASASGLVLLTAWQDGELVACGALKLHDDRLGELKTMRVVDAWRGRGVGEAMMSRLMSRARDGGCRRLALETGGSEPFAAALAFYKRNGFTATEPFADYREDPFSVYLARDL